MQDLRQDSIDQVAQLLLPNSKTNRGFDCSKVSGVAKSSLPPPSERYWPVNEYRYTDDSKRRYGRPSSGVARSPRNSKRSGVTEGSLSLPSSSPYDTDGSSGSTKSRGSSETSSSEATDSSSPESSRETDGVCTPASSSTDYTDISSNSSRYQGIYGTSHSRPTTLPPLTENEIVTGLRQPNVQEPAVHEASRSNSRRTSSGSCFPPSLTRQEGRFCDFVTALCKVSTCLVTAMWPLSNVPPRATSAFSNAVLPLQTYIAETLRRSKSTFSTLQVALFYLILLKGSLAGYPDFTKEQTRMRPQQTEDHSSDPTTESVFNGQSPVQPRCRTLQCGRRMFLTALMLSCKYLQDRNYSARAWSKISGLPCLEVNKNEKVYLEHIDYRLHIEKPTFENWSRLVCELVSFHQGNNGYMGGELDYSRILRELSPELLSDSDKTDDLLNRIQAGNFTVNQGADFTRRRNPSKTPPLPPLESLVFRQKNISTVGSSNDFEKPHPQNVTYECNSAGGPSRVMHRAPPHKPMLPNLPTPGGTPNPSSIAAFGSTQQGNSSTSHQSDGRGGPVANLERCPPPQPAPSGMSMVYRQPEVSPPWTSSAKLSAISSVSSPESVFSESYTGLMRSRSSSTSSNSSWDTAPLRNFRLEAKAGPSPSPLGRHCTFAFSGTDREDATTNRASPPRSRIQRSDSTSTLSQYVNTDQMMDDSVSPEIAANHSVALSRGNAAETSPTALEDSVAPARRYSTKKTSKKQSTVDSVKGNKRSRARESEKGRQLQREAARLIKTGNGIPDAIPEDSYIPVPDGERSPCQGAEEVTEVSKRTCPAEKFWAKPRTPFPVPGTKNSKRFAAAMECHKLPAAELAAAHLRRKMQGRNERIW